jgi:hypothetical protein
MRPYIVRLLRDLQEIERERFSALRELWPNRNLESRKRVPGHRSAERRLDQILSAELNLSEECRALGIEIGSQGRCELLFPTSVDSKLAFFVWRANDLLPVHWRWEPTSDDQFIPEKWYRQFAEDTLGRRS